MDRKKAKNKGENTGKTLKRKEKNAKLDSKRQ